MKKYYYSKEQFEKDLQDIIRQMAVDNWKPDLIIGPARGGLISAVYLSHYFDVKMAPVCLSLRDFRTNPDDTHIPVKNIEEYRRILVIDDIIDSGATMRVLLPLIEEKHNLANELEIKVATLFYNCTNEFKQRPDYYVNVLDKAKQDEWIVFPVENWWNAK